MTRFIFGENVHIFLSISNVALPASFGGALTLTKDLFSPKVQLCMVMVRSQSGRWMVIVITESDEVPRQWSMAFRMIVVASGAAKVVHGDNKMAQRLITMGRFCMPDSLWFSKLDCVYNRCLR